MAQISGTQCDVCKKIEVNGTEGWLVVKPRVQAGTGERHDIDVCSNDCLIKLGRIRKGEAPQRKTWTDDQKLEVLAYAESNGVKAAAAYHDVDQSLIYRWKRDMENEDQ